MNTLGSPVDELSGLPDSPSGSNDVTLDDPEEEAEEQPVTKDPLGNNPDQSSKCKFTFN